MLISPLEQFSIISISFISNLVCYLLVIILLIMLIISNLYLLNKHIGFWYFSIKDYSNLIFIFLTIFYIILLSNILGMIPYTITITAQLVIVLSISLPTFIALNINGIIKHKHNLLYLFLPMGSPIALIPVLVILELFSYFVRVLSLTLRLVANLVSGHILMKILLIVLIENLLIFPLILPILILELFVAFIQAYVFLLLLISYYNDILYPH